MHYEDNHHRHPNYRDMRRERERDRSQDRQQQHPENFNDFSSRWNNPKPFVHPDEQQSSWQPHEMGRPQDQHYYHQRYEEWHDPRHNRFEQRRQEPSWEHRDERFDRNNQRAEDRWLQQDSPLMPNPQRHEHSRRRHPRDHYRDEY